MIEKLTQPLLDTALSLGQYVMYQLRELETPPLQPASITYYGTKETPLDGEPQPFSLEPNYTTAYERQLDFHKQELIRGAETMPEGQLAYHRQKVAVLGELVIRRAA